MTIYVFDLDGTLTPARRPMEDDFAEKFVPWLKQNKGFLATGSDVAKVAEQMPAEVMNSFTGIYASMGNTLWKDGEYVYQRDFTPEPELLEDLEEFRRKTTYPNQLFDNYIERRVGMINFSPLGRNCPYEAREAYRDWDKEHGERLAIQKVLSAKYPQYDFVVGGSISMDIIKKGHGKGQVASHLRETYPDEEINFFGDRTFLGGNDYELAQALRILPDTKVFQVDDPNDVLRILEI